MLDLHLTLEVAPANVQKCCNPCSRHTLTARLIVIQRENQQLMHLTNVSDSASQHVFPLFSKFYIESIALNWGWKFMKSILYWWCSPPAALMLLFVVSVTCWSIDDSYCQSRCSSSWLTRAIESSTSSWTIMIAEILLLALSAHSEYHYSALIAAWTPYQISVDC